MKTRFALAAAAACVPLALLAGCGSSGHPAGNAQSGSDRSETEAIVACYRAHGDPGFPDPTYDPSDGRWHFAESPGSAPDTTRQACQHLFPSQNPSPPVPQAQFQALVRLAECIRQHGDPSFPDPNPQGQFLVPSSQAKTPALVNAMNACRRYIPSGGIDEVAAP